MPGSGEHRSLTLSDAQSSKTNEFVANVESSIIYYGDNTNQNSTGFFASKMFCNGPNYLSSTVMYESLVIEGHKNQITDNGKACHLAEPVVAIYPSEGTFYSDHPFVIPKASWVTPAKKAAAEIFRDFLRAPSQQQKALHYGFRPALPNITIGAPIDVQSPVQPLGLNRQKINDQINAIDASGNTRLYDTIDEQVKALAALQTKRIKVVVVLTDGMDDASNISQSQLINDIKTSGTNAGEGMKVFTIAYGNDADFSGLTQIASATGGQQYAGSPQNIRHVYYEISQFF